MPVSSRLNHYSMLTLLGAAAWLALPGQAVSQPDRSAECPPTCRLDIVVPDDERRPPEINIDSLIVSPGGEIDFGASKGVLIRFEGGQSPFVGENGRPIRTLTIAPNKPMRFRVRTEGEDCKAAPGCKYSVKALGTGNRPILDPYMIIK